MNAISDIWRFCYIGYGLDVHQQGIKDFIKGGAGRSVSTHYPKHARLVHKIWVALIIELDLWSQDRIFSFLKDGLTDVNDLSTLLLLPKGVPGPRS